MATTTIVRTEPFGKHTRNDSIPGLGLHMGAGKKKKIRKRGSGNQEIINQELRKNSQKLLVDRDLRARWVGAPHCETVNKREKRELGNQEKTA